MLIKASAAAKKWGINERRVRCLARQGRIKGAVLINKRWYISSDAKKPDFKSYKESLEQQKYPYNTFSSGEYGIYGGVHMPESFAKYFDPMLEAFKQMISTSAFDKRAKAYLKDTPMYVPEKFNKTLGNVKVIIKREDLNTGGSLYMNQAYLLALLLKRIKKDKIMIAAGSAAYALAIAKACHDVGVMCKIFIPYRDYLKQTDEFDKIHEYNPEFLYICEREGSLYNATNYAFREYLMNDGKSLFCLNDAVGPHPIPVIVEFCQSCIGHAVQLQLKRMGITRVSAIVAPANVASNALGIFAKASSRSKLVVVESSTSNSIIRDGHVGIVDGMKTKTLTSKGYCEFNGDCACGAMSFPALNPKIADGIERGKYQVGSVTDIEAMQACKEFFELEGIFPALEDGYTLAYIKKRAKRMKSGNILMCFTSKGDKDKDFIVSTLSSM